MKDINEMTAEQLIDYMDNGAFYDSTKKSDVKHAMGILKKYADKGTADAQYKLGQLYNSPKKRDMLKSGMQKPLQHTNPISTLQITKYC